MATILAILGAVQEFFKGLELFDKWFTKSTTEKVEESKAAIDEEQRRVEAGGKPKW